MNRRPYSLLPSLLTPGLEQSLENFFSPMSASLGNLRESMLAPRADVAERGDHYAICVDMPGVPLQDIEVDVNDGILTIQGTRSASKSGEDAGVHRVERMMGTFQRRFALPDNVDFEAVSATSRDGVLEVVVPKLPERAPRKIKVRPHPGADLDPLELGSPQQEPSQQEVSSQ